uniref:receptor protein-tyrosine kinase n=1 Tax=Panagrellus redivivus TaxID=6233 RepID=A0A7E4WA43_PANRE
MEDQLDPRNLVITKTQHLGKGCTATVYKGLFKTSSDYTPVAVKILNNDYAELVNTAELIDELKILRRVQHPNIVEFIGHTYIDRILHIVTEYMAGGSLHGYIKDESTVLKYQNTFDYMDQILSAMVYLTQQQIVHRDLAARNCLMNGDHTVLKVSDFGLSRSVDFKGEYQILHNDIKLPTHSVAIEAFLFCKFTEKTDVWSFGVLVWELFTRGATPYDPMNYIQIQGFLNEGYQLHCPEALCATPISGKIYGMMLCCWDAEPKKRPTFEQLQDYIRDIVTTNVNKQFMDTQLGCFRNSDTQRQHSYVNQSLT